jgi:hypothetical protein
MSESQTAGELVFIGEQSPQGGFTARAVGASIFTEGDTLDALRANIREAVACHYGDGRQPPVIRLRIVTEEVLRLDG